MIFRVGIFVLILLQTACVVTRSQLKSDGSAAAPSEVQESQSVAMTEEQQQAAEQLQLQEINEQFRQLNGRIEILEQKIFELNQERSLNQEQREKKWQSLEERLKLFEEAILKIEKQVAGGTTSSSAAPKKKGNYAQAEDAFAQKQWKDAIVKYQKYRDLNPKGNRYADATYKIGVSFQELGMSGEAKAFFEEVIQKYPGTNESKKASYRLKNLRASK